MTKKFNNVPIGADTRIILQTESKIGGHDALYQKWVWDGIVAESIIFDNKDVIKLTRGEIETEVRQSPLLELEVDSTVTIRRSNSGFTFVNFNFVA